jgi:hypothetical protein
MSIGTPKPRANAARIAKDVAQLLPLSTFETPTRVNPARTANASCERPSSFRSRRTVGPTVPGLVM